MDTRAPIHLGGRPSSWRSESRPESRYFEGFGCGHGGLVGGGTRAEVLHVLLLPDSERADAIGSYWGKPKTRTLGEPRLGNISFELEVGVIACPRQESNLRLAV
jgi:hypothetical protein